MKIYMRLITLLLFLTILGWAHTAAAQSMPPTIITFTGDLDTTTLADAEAGTTLLTLSWRVVNLTTQYHLDLETYRLNAWESLVGEGTILLPTDSRQFELQHSLTFRSPTYRLSLRDDENRIIDQNILVIPYADGCAPACNPTVTAFTTSVEQVDPEALAQRTALVPVAWSITDRPPTANPVFEQVMDDGSAVVIELPRDFLWIPSNGEGLVAPLLPQSGVVHLRVRLVDLVTGDVYDEQTLDLSAGEAVTQAAGRNGADSGQTPRIVYFTVSPNPIDPNGTVTLSWEATGGRGVVISWMNQQMQFVNLYDQPLRGTTRVSLTDVKPYVYDGMINRAHFDIAVTDENGQILEDGNGQAITERVVVTLSTNMRINMFTIAPNPVELGGTVTLSWDVSNAVSISISRLSPSGVFLSASAISNLPASGSIGLVVPEEYTTAVSYYLTATDTNGLVQGQLVTASIIGN